MRHPSSRRGLLGAVSLLPQCRSCRSVATAAVPPLQRLLLAPVLGPFRSPCLKLPATPTLYASCRRGLTRVCRRWRLLVDSPPLLRRVSVSLRAIGPDDAAEDSGSDGDGMYWWYNYWQDPERPIQHILRFFGWLKRQAAPHVEQLSISLGQLVINNEIENEETITSELCCVLHTCTRLRVGGGWGLTG